MEIEILQNKKEGFTFSEKRITSLLEIIKKIKEELIKMMKIEQNKKYSN